MVLHMVMDWVMVCFVISKIYYVVGQILGSPPLCTKLALAVFQSLPLSML